MTAAWIMDRRLHELPNLSTEMPPKTRAALRGMRGFNALDDTTEGPRASFSRSSGRGGPKGRIAGPQSSQSSSERRIGTSFRDTRGDYLEGVYQPNETMGSSFEDSDYQPYEKIDRGNVMVTLVKLIGFRLTEVVQIWFTTLKHYRSLGFAPFTREEFTQAFMDRFLPESCQIMTSSLLSCRVMLRIWFRLKGRGSRVDAIRKIEVGRKEVGMEKKRSKRNRGEGSSRYRDPSKGKDVNIAGQPGRRDGNLLRGSAFFSPPNQRRNFQFHSPPRSSDFSGINYKRAMSSGMTNSNLRQSGQHNQEMARGSMRPNFATASTRNVKRDKGKRVAFSSQGRSVRPTQQGASRRGQARVFALTPQDAHVSNVVVTGNLFICGYEASILFDPRSTHSFVSSNFIPKLGKHYEYMDEPLVVTTLLEESYVMEYVFRSCVVQIKDRDT
ncbi:Uncharacterized protein TCM_013367 [Theobroma cacao]|uniref:Uncharacterized protein n=1 Tax=Theobroma cacao TaxID=3641 RepID=A0A061G3F5_THECC|nr:Uncharacterized protein TCM_013367 [Theobroma cacao]